MALVRQGDNLVSQPSRLQGFFKSLELFKGQILSQLRLPEDRNIHIEYTHSVYIIYNTICTCIFS